VSHLRVSPRAFFRLSQFTLVIVVDHFMRHCHAVWSSERQIGVAFD